MPATLSYKTNGQILVAEGEKIPEGKILAEDSTTAETVKINISKLLIVSPKKCLNFLLKKPGDKVKTKDIIARKKSLMGLKKRSIKSPCDGEVTSLEVESGELSISLPADKKELVSPVAGKIKKIDKGEITIAVGGEEIILIDAIGDFSKGEILFFKTDEVDHLLLDDKVKGKILCGNIIHREAMEKAIALGAKAIIAVNVSEDDWLQYKKGKKLAFIDNQEKIMVNIGLINEADLKILLKYQSQQAGFYPDNKKIIIEV